MLAHGCCKKLVENMIHMNAIFWIELEGLRMRSIQARFFVVVDIEYDGPLWSVLRKVFHHLHQSDDPHRVVGCTGCSGN